MRDPIVEEVRRYRNEHASKFNYDLDAICDDFKRKHQEYVKLLCKAKKTPMAPQIEYPHQAEKCSIST